jgi:protein-S-isoprenylcysteine O-methyltransferase
VKISPPAILGLAYFLSEAVLAITRRSSAKTASKDANSLRFLWIVIGVSIWLGIHLHRSSPAAALTAPFAVLGYALFVIGVVLRWYSIIHLGRFFTIDVAIATDHQLVDTGPYRFLRHPSYTGALLAFAGFALVMQNWASVIAITVPIFLAFLYRIHVEERALLAALGDRYCVYMRKTNRLIPFLY